MHQSMTRSEENIVVPGHQKIPQIQQEQSKETCHPATSALAPIMPAVAVEDKQNSADAIVPFAPIFSDNDVPDFDLLSFITQIENEQKKDDAKEGQALMIPTTTNVTATSNQNVLNNIVPRSMFSNCKIGNLTLNFNK